MNDTRPLYIIDPEEVAVELVRLQQLSRFALQTLGPFPLLDEDLLSSMRDILDLGCGPGLWTLEAAFRTDCQVTGVDPRKTLINYAKATAKVQIRDNAHFAVMDLRERLHFPDHSFDLVNGWFLSSLMNTCYWPVLLQECFRILRSGGILLLSEIEIDISSSSSLQRLNTLFYQAMRQQQRTFSADGHSLGVAYRLGGVLQQAGFHQVRQQPFLMDSSEHTELYAPLMTYRDVTFTLLRHYLVSSGQVTEEEFDQMHRLMNMESLQEGFTCLSFGLTALGIKP